MTFDPNQKLWEIDMQIEQTLLESVDQETGEILPEAENALDALELKLEEKLLNCGLVIDGHNLEAESIEKVAKQLKARAARHRGYAAWLLAYAEKHAPREKKWMISDPRVVLDRAISQRVEPLADDWTDEEKMELIDPKFLTEKVTLSIDKAGARSVMKTGQRVKGLMLTTYNKLRVKRGPSLAG